MGLLYKPSGPDLKFAARTLLAGLAAYFTASRLGLAEPQWALMTVYIVSQPLSGMVLAKSVYRLVGTLVGTGVAVAFIHFAAEDPYRLTLLMTVWLGLCTYLASLYRGFRSYGFVLAGYTAAIVGLLGWIVPDNALAFALARCTEIGLGIGFAALASILLAPHTLGAELSIKLGEALSAVAGYAADAMDAEVDDAEFQRRRSAVIQQVLALDTLRTHALFDSNGVRSANRAIRRLIYDLLRSLSAVITVHEQLRRLPAEETGPPARVAREGIRGLDLAGEGVASRRALLELRDRVVTELDRGLEDRRSAAAVPRMVLREKLKELLERLAEAAGLNHAIRAGTPERERGASPQLHFDVDRPTAWRNASRTMIAFGAGMGVWLATGYASLMFIIILIAVTCSLFATFDNPIALSWQFLRGAAVAAVVAFAGRFGVPGLGEEPVLTLAVAGVPLFAAGLAMARPTVTVSGTAFGIMYSSLLLGPEAMLATPAGFGLAAAGLGVGLGGSMLAFWLLRPLSPQRRARRLMASVRAELAAMGGDQPPSRSELETRLYDRVDQLTLRLDLARAEHRRLVQQALRALYCALEARTLYEAEAGDGLPRALRRRIGLARRRFAAACAGPSEKRGRRVDKALSALADAEGAVLEATGAEPDRQRNRLIAALALIREVLVRERSFFVTEAEARAVEPPACQQGEQA